MFGIALARPRCFVADSLSRTKEGTGHENVTDRAGPADVAATSRERIFWMELGALAMEGAVGRTEGNRTIWTRPVGGETVAGSVDSMAVSVIGTIVWTREGSYGIRTIWP